MRVCVGSVRRALCPCHVFRVSVAVVAATKHPQNKSQSRGWRWQTVQPGAALRMGAASRRGPPVCVGLSQSTCALHCLCVVCVCVCLCLFVCVWVRAECCAVVHTVALTLTSVYAAFVQTLRHCLCVVVDVIRLPSSAHLHTPGHGHPSTVLDWAPLELTIHTKCFFIRRRCCPC